MLKNYATYIGANALGIISGLISFPIMARLLSYEEFGIFGYFQAHILILAGLLKLGSQHSIVRFLPRFRQSTSPTADTEFATNFIWFPVGAAFFASSAIALCLWAWNRVSALETYPYLAILVWLSLGIALFSVLLNWYVAQEKAGRFTLFSLSSGWLELCFIMVTLFFINQSALGVYQARLASTGVIAICALVILHRNAPRDWSTLDGSTLKESLAYGMFLLLNELAIVILAYVDRYMIEAATGSFAALGVYTLGYNLAMFVMKIVEQSFNKAFIPVINRYYESDGVEPVRSLKTRMSGLMAFPAAFISVMLITVGNDALRIFGGADKMASAPVFIWTGVGFAFMPVLTAAGFGLTLKQKSKVVLVCTLIAVVLNIGLNIVLLPRLGIMGAVYATLASYLTMVLLKLWWCPKELKSDFPFSKLPLPLICGALVWLTAHYTGLFGLTNPFFRIAAAGILAMVLFAVPAYFFDREIRDLVKGIFGKSRGSRSSSSA